MGTANSLHASASKYNERFGFVYSSALGVGLCRLGLRVRSPLTWPISQVCVNTCVLKIVLC